MPISFALFYMYNTDNEKYDLIFYVYFTVMDYSYIGTPIVGIHFPKWFFYLNMELFAQKYYSIL